MQTASAVGFYGKLPCKGDFLQRRVPQQFVDVWDAWLQECMHVSRQQLQEQWLDAYLTSPVWRFAFAEGVCGSGAYAGVMVPSVDRVGRYFPLTIVAQLSSDDCLLDVACDTARPWFDAVESLALSALQASDLDLDAFDDEVASSAQRISQQGTQESPYLRALMQQADFGHRPAQWHVPLASTQSLQRAVNVFACRELERSLRPLAMWWTEGSDAVAPGWICTRGLPEGTTFVAMLASRWNQAGWVSLEPDFPPERRAAAVGGAHPGSMLSASADSAASTSSLPAVESAPAPLEIMAWHEPITREWGANRPQPHFVMRPELGLWGVTFSQEPPTSVAAQTVADVLQSVGQSGTLTALVEEVRRALERVHRQPKGLASASAPASGARTVVFLARGDECALVCAGDVQAVRYRSAEVLPIAGTGGGSQTSADTSAPASVDPEASLMDLIESPASPDTRITVRYEGLRSGDAWVLTGTMLLDEPRLPELASALAADALAESPPLAAVRTICRLEDGDESGTLPVLLLAARPALRS